MVFFVLSTSLYVPPKDIGLLHHRSWIVHDSIYVASLGGGLHRSMPFSCLATSSGCLFDNQAESYLLARPTYPSEWYSMLANETSSHSLAWDLGTGNGQAAIDVAEHYEKVIATDVSVAQLKLAMPHPRVHYLHTPLSLSDDDLIGLIGGEASVDLVTAAAAVHWFDLGRLYYVVNHVLKPSGVFSVWAYNEFSINYEVDVVVKRFCATTMPYWHENVKKYPFECYKTLPFPFENVGLGSEGYPLRFDIPVRLSLEGLFGLFRSWSAVATAKERGVELLSENMVKELKDVWGESNLVRDVVFKGFMLAGKPVPNVDLI